MTLKRLDHVSVVVDDLAAAIAFFSALGMTLEGEMSVEGSRARGWTASTGSKVSKSTSL
jgi:catechol 2,3-dioxygenase-like lactoylglutathione lyase family enzyme